MALNLRFDAPLVTVLAWGHVPGCTPAVVTYAGRGAVERENGRLKNEWALLPLRVRRIERVALHADLTMLARLASALVTART
jgi:hypothetical protein